MQHVTVTVSDAENDMFMKQMVVYRAEAEGVMVEWMIPNRLINREGVIAIVLEELMAEAYERLGRR